MSSRPFQDWGIDKHESFVYSLLRNQLTDGSPMDKRLFELHADICKTFASPRRLEILYHLRDGEESFAALQQATGLAKANLSQHLGMLRDRGVVTVRREGQQSYFAVSNLKIIEACDLMRQVLHEQLEERREVVDGR